MLKKEVLFFSSFFLWMFCVTGSCSLFVCWVCMELTTFFFIPMIFKDKICISSAMSSWKYFVVQSVSSFLFLFGVFFGKDFVGENFSEVIILLSMSIKLGVFPFVWWVFQVCENMNWVCLFLLFTILKIFPLIILAKSVSNSNLIGILTLMVISMVGGFLWLMFTNFSFQILLTVSSVVNISWTLIAIMVDLTLAFFYLFVYSVILLGVCFKLSFSGQESVVLNSNLKDVKVFFTILVFISGIPPMGIFFSKLEVVSLFIDLHPVLIISITICSAFSSFLYFKILFLNLFGEKKNDLEVKFSENVVVFSLLLLFILTILLICSIFFS